MGGKSAALACAGFLCACAALGVPPPARAASLPLPDTIAWIGGEGPEDRSRLLSSYAAEVLRAKDVLVAASPRALVLVDEFARTTGPREGRALLIAFIEALRARGAFALVATHFDGSRRRPACRTCASPGCAKARWRRSLAGDAGAALDAINAAMDYRLVAADSASATSDALELARLLGFDQAFLARARALYDQPQT